MPLPSYFNSIAPDFMQAFSRVHRTSALTADAYGDATFTEETSTGYRGFVQQAGTKGEYVILAGKEIQYDAVVYTQATALIYESDRLLFFNSRSTSIAQRYVVHGIEVAWDGYNVDHKNVYCRTEIV